MTDMKSKGAAYSNRSARKDDPLQQSAVKDIFGQLSDFGPRALALQKGLLGGLVRSQEREVRRLSKADETDPMVIAGKRRIEAASSLLVQVEKMAGMVDKAAQGVRARNMFHGYVVGSEGAPAVGYIVQVMREDLGGRALNGKTDDTGYFEIRFDKPGGSGARSEKEAGASSGGETLVERLQRIGAHQSERAAATDAAAAQPAVEVDILDANGKTIVFRDPSPPSFATAETVFRYYPLLDA